MVVAEKKVCGGMDLWFLNGVGSKAVDGGGWDAMKAEDGSKFWQQAAAEWRWMGLEAHGGFCTEAFR